MKKSKLSAFLLAALIAMTASAGCNNKNKSSSRERASNEKVTSPVQPDKIGTRPIEGKIGEEISENNTAFTLNSVIDTGFREDGSKFVYFDITLRNETDKEYNLSTLNNFYLELADGVNVFSDVRTQIYAKSNFKDEKYFIDPFNIPSSGQFSGIIGGFIIDEDTNEFNVCFYPTGEDPNNKETVIRYQITADDITDAAPEMMK